MTAHTPSAKKNPMNKTILIVDDKKNTLKVLSAILADEGYTTLEAASSHEALDLIATEEQIDAILSDLKMPGMDGLELFYHLKRIKTQIPFILMTAHGSIQSAVEAMKNGVSNYLIKPLNYEELSIVLERAIRENEISVELADLRREVRDKYAAKNIIGCHPAMLRVFEMLETVAPTTAPVLLYGETGTGKELLAKTIHASSQRHNRPLVCINSAALPDELLEAELFGYKKGAFTGAIASRRGQLETADGGTLFLDEISHLSLPLQAKLLRFLQEGTFDPLGGIATKQVDVRIIAATNVDLVEEIKAKRFLGDLLYRIEVFTITLPPLRERGDDLLLLVNRFMDKYSAEYQKPIRGAQPAVLDLLARYPWPGNIRELENCIARCVILAKEDVIRPQDLPSKILEHQEEQLPPKDLHGLLHLPQSGITLKEVEGQVIEKTLQQCKGNKSQAAKMLGLSRKTLYEKISLHRLS